MEQTVPALAYRALFKLNSQYIVKEELYYCFAFCGQHTKDVGQQTESTEKRNKNS